jgi:hypothetical protein
MTTEVQNDNGRLRLRCAKSGAETGAKSGNRGMLIWEGGTLGFDDRRNVCVSEISSLSGNRRKI